MNGSGETNKLKANVEDQLNRLLTQLQDLEDMREDLDDDEYESTKEETLEQMKEFEISLNNMVSGNLSLVSEIGNVQLKIQSAIKSAIKPEVKKMFQDKEHEGLRIKLYGLESDVKLGRISESEFLKNSGDIVLHLEKLGVELTLREIELLDKQNEHMKSYTMATENIGTVSITQAVNDIKKSI
jgi:hypothetical protein